MLVGGLGSLFIQMLHPHTMAGVAQHSRYREDPSGDSSRRRTSSASRPTARGPRPTRRLNGSSRAPSRSWCRRRRRPLLRERSAPPGVGPRRRDLDVPHGLPTLRRGAIERRRRRSLRARNGEPGSRPGMVDPPTSVAALEATIQRFRPELRLSPTAPRRVTSSCTVSSADRSSVRSTGCSFAVRSPS